MLLLGILNISIKYGVILVATTFSPTPLHDESLKATVWAAQSANLYNSTTNVVWKVSDGFIVHQSKIWGRRRRGAAVGCPCRDTVSERASLSETAWVRASQPSSPAPRHPSHGEPIRRRPSALVIRYWAAEDRNPPGSSTACKRMQREERDERVMEDGGEIRQAKEKRWRQRNKPMHTERNGVETVKKAG